MSDDDNNGTSNNTGGRFMGVVIGWCLFVGSIGLMFWNEGRTVKRHNDIDEAEERYVVLKTSDLENTNLTLADFADKLVHVSGDISTRVVVQDPLFGVRGDEDEDENMLKLRRHVEMYQWDEEKHSEGSKENKKYYYTYHKVWSSNHIDSTYFHESGHDNPSFPFDQATWSAHPILLDETLELGEPAVDLVNWFADWKHPLDLNMTTSELSSAKKEHLSLGDSGRSFYYHHYATDANIENQNQETDNNERDYTVTVNEGDGPDIGDTIISFKVVHPTTISIIAYFDGSRLNEYITEGDRPFILVVEGTVDATMMLQNARDENTQIAWVLRFVLYILNIFGICLILQPIAVVADWIPLIGDCLADNISGCLIPAVALLISTPLSLFLIALGWLWYRPHVALPLVIVGFLLAAAIGFWVYKQSQKSSGRSNNTNIYNTNMEKPEAAPGSNDEPEIPVVVIPAGDVEAQEEPEIVVKK